MTIPELKDLAKSLNLEYDNAIKKGDLLSLIFDKMGGNL